MKLVKSSKHLYSVIALIAVACFCFAASFMQPTAESKEPSASSWMSGLPDNAPLNSLSIPGTHESGTARTTIFTQTVASCQDSDIPKQLENGIRYLDIRLNGDLLVNHAGVSCYKSTIYRLYFSHVLEYVTKFLKNHPKETVIIQIKEEGKSKKYFSDSVNNILKSQKNVYHPGKSINKLTLRDLRGKILILTRSGDIDLAYMCTGWADDCPCSGFRISRGSAILQDTYNDKTSDAKMNHIEDFYNTVWNNPIYNYMLRVCFTSCIGPLCPKLVAKTVNSKFQKFLNENPNKSTGIVLMDNPDKFLIRDIYIRN